MTSRTPITPLLPRLLPAQTRAAALCNIAVVLVVALAGAGLVHLLAYHLPPGVPLDPGWMPAALSLLAHCPLVGPLGLALFVAVLLGLQVGALGIFDVVWPMHMTVTMPMVMDGKLMAMAMPMAPLLPLGALHAAVAVLLGLLLCRVERRLTRLRALVAGHLRRLRQRHQGVVPPHPLPVGGRLLRDRHGPSLFARPPPSSVAA